MDLNSAFPNADGILQRCIDQVALNTRSVNDFENTVLVDIAVHEGSFVDRLIDLSAFALDHGHVDDVDGIVAVRVAEAIGALRQYVAKNAERGESGTVGGEERLVIDRRAAVPFARVIGVVLSASACRPGPGSPPPASHVRRRRRSPGPFW